MESLYMEEIDVSLPVPTHQKTKALSLLELMTGF